MRAQSRLSMRAFCLHIVMLLSATLAAQAQTNNAAWTYPVIPKSFQTVTLADLDKPGTTIPQSFMGFSHEWPYIEELYNIPQYQDVIKLLQSFGSGPLVMRIGGGSTDFVKEVPKPEVWDALSKVYRSTGMTYIIGLNFYDQNYTLSKGKMDAALKGLPRESILSFEIGNEPDYYFNKSSTHWNGTKLVASFDDYIRCCFHTEWYNMAEYLSCPNGPSSCVNFQFTGPAWGHLNLRTTTIDWFLRTNGKWLEMTSVHWYKATSETFNTPSSLLDEDPIRKEMANLVEIVKVSNSYGKPLRVAEMNTISNSGRRGVSDVFAAALWTLDGSLEVAQAGGVGVNFHQGAGQNLYAAVIRWYQNDKLAPPMLRPPFYGMLMFQMAVRGGSRLLSREATWRSDAEVYKWIKVWPLEDRTTKELRWVVINKNPSKSGVAVLRVNRDTGYAASASVIRLLAPGPDPLSAMQGITLGGINYGNGGVKNGRDVVETVPAAVNERTIRISLYMPPASAALVRLPRGAGGVTAGH